MLVFPCVTKPALKGNFPVELSLVLATTPPKDSHALMALLWIKAALQARAISRFVQGGMEARGLTIAKNWIA